MKLQTHPRRWFMILALGMIAMLVFTMSVAASDSSLHHSIGLIRQGGTPYRPPKRQPRVVNFRSGSSGAVQGFTVIVHADGEGEISASDAPPCTPERTGLNAAIELYAGGGDGVPPIDVEVESGSVVSVQIEGRPSLRLPAICYVGEEFMVATAISPSGIAFNIESEPGDEFPEVQFFRLPAIAYAESGLWFLQVMPDYPSDGSLEFFQLAIQIVPSQNPFAVYLTNEWILGGFQPSEEVVGLVFGGEEHNGGEIIGQIEFQVDEDGYALIDATSVESGGIPLLYGDTGSIVGVLASGGDAVSFGYGTLAFLETPLDVLDRIFMSQVWGFDEPYNECPPLAWSENLIDAHAVVVASTPLQTEPNQNSAIVMELQPYSEEQETNVGLRILEPPVCNETVWWHVQVESLEIQPPPSDGNTEEQVVEGWVNSGVSVGIPN